MFVCWFVLKILIVALSLILVANLCQAKIVLGRKLLLYLDVRHFMCFKLFIFLVVYVCWLGCGSKLCIYVCVIFLLFYLFVCVSMCPVLILCIILPFLWAYTSLDILQHISSVIYLGGLTWSNERFTIFFFRIHNFFLWFLVVLKRTFSVKDQHICLRSCKYNQGDCPTTSSC